MEPDRVLTLRELNPATLARQMFLTREPLPVSDTVERLVGLQAQVPNPPTSASGPGCETSKATISLVSCSGERSRVTLMRATLHLITAGD